MCLIPLCLDCCNWLYKICFHRRLSNLPANYCRPYLIASHKMKGHKRAAIQATCIVATDVIIASLNFQLCRRGIQLQLPNRQGKQVGFLLGRFNQRRSKAPSPHTLHCVSKEPSNSISSVTLSWHRQSRSCNDHQVPSIWARGTSYWGAVSVAPPFPSLRQIWLYAQIWAGSQIARAPLWLWMDSKYEFYKIWGASQIAYSERDTLQEKS